MNKTLLPQAQFPPAQGCFEKKEARWFPLRLFCSGSSAKTAAGKKLRAPLPLRAETALLLILGWEDYNASFWQTARLRRGARAMDRACLLVRVAQAPRGSHAHATRSDHRTLRRHLSQYVESRNL
jgi:hypothetical protein